MPPRRLSRRYRFFARRTIDGEGARPRAAMVNVRTIALRLAPRITRTRLLAAPRDESLIHETERPTNHFNNSLSFMVPT